KVELLMQQVAGALGHRLERMPAGAAEVIGELVRGDREKIGLQLTAVVEVGQAVEEADERLLHDVLARGTVTDAALDKGQQPPLVTSDQPLPGARVALADLLHKQTVAVGRHGGVHRMNSWIRNYRGERRAIAIGKPTVWRRNLLVVPASAGTTSRLRL